ncbi:Gfo/Idh/MocA family oxidoreductase [Anaerosalibacter massiliensis]|uniref:Gfo/Idh/MocA family oxidoreductase n=1 Tax=Anaerosalibacter massiliensis TaxID=1347392 RepID=UPI0005B27D27|nr:Gfo/Idh/MocA family oxidoreductase [Anaerosalibacter massiliensis]
MKKVITYGTFDLFHEGHRRLLQRAKKLGDYLVVGVTTDNYDESRGKLNVQQSLMERIKNVKDSGLADQIIIEEYEGQKINDIQKYNIDIFAIGSDWIGKFDYIKEYCEVIYLERTKGISSTQLRAVNNGMLKLGIVGYGRIANRFIRESKYVSGVNVEGVYGPNLNSLKKFVNKHELAFYETNYDIFLEQIDAVYIASPHLTHYEYSNKALEKGKHVLCEKPMVLKMDQVEKLYSKAKNKGVVLLEAIKTAYSPGFIRLISLAKSGLIGDIKNIDATFTKLVKGDIRELDALAAGGSVTELASYPLLVIVKLLGSQFEDYNFYSYYDDEKNVDLFTKINLKYKDAIATAKVGLGVKSEGDLIISGTKGYIYVPSPWWKTEYFEVRFEDFSNNKKQYHKFEGDGLRYELAEFVSIINSKNLQTYKLTSTESCMIAKVIENFRSGINVIKI